MTDSDNLCRTTGEQQGCGQTTNLAGADVVKIFPAGVGGELVGKPLIAAKDFAAITKNAIDFVAPVQEAKNP